MERLGNAMGRLHRSLLAGDEDNGSEEGPMFGDSDGFCSLSTLQRMYAFLACLVVGLVCMFLSLLVFYKPIKFAVLFSFGNILAVGSTAFLVGPGQQARMMLDPVRVYATAIYVGCVIIALVCALWIHNKVLTILAMISEICALMWYSLSYVPFARRMISELLISCCDTEL